ncbi:uncharacterized protein PV09_01075 [Verruconis gallopava]|uniref:F-box domain-containing protein n=1 Tax=Verruconis gallopava TaxID=253628 RepID=A0A0D2AN44_9PEZI|nr:uncharacterized protein PV09_01075 [Verruconis gallopava]KIW08143.1 hypothetical protein PV09_01075 [Verruconis gallopava]
MADKMSLKDSLISLATISSSKGTLSRYSHDSASGFTSRASASSYSATSASNGIHFEDVPRLVKTPWEADRSMRASMPRSTRRPAAGRSSLPERIFRELPDEIYERIVTRLELNYFCDASGTCINCYTRDLYNLSLTSRAWCRAAKQQLYSKIWILADSHNGSSEMPWHKLKLLRRTLRENPLLSRFVKEMHFPDAQIVYQESQIKTRQAIINTLASLVMAAPNLEKFSGLYLTYDHVFDRLTHALSTRGNLKEKTWVLRRSDVGVDEDGVYWSNHDEFGQADNHDAFLRSHDNWKNLELLCLFGQTTGRMDYRSFAATFRNLPSLKHLLISDFDSSQFSDRTLYAIPPSLQSLRLQDIPGVTEKGLARYFNTPAAITLRNLSLIKLEIASALLISNILAKCTNLKRFTLAQDVSPALPLGSDPPHEDGILYASNSLEYLHWDTIAYGPSIQDLANSIAGHAFPKLKVLRAPSDDGGVLQRLCAPQPGWSPDSPNSDEEENPFNHWSLPSAQREAQRRKTAASQDPFITIVVSDEEGNVQHTYVLRTYMGTLDSTIRYSLDPDVQGSNDFIAGLNDLLITREIVLDGGEKYCSNELHKSAGARGSFESSSTSSSGNSLRNLALGRRRSIKSKKPDFFYKGHKTRKILVSPEMRVFF